jgi:two-component system, OmpR family, phosphate regulon response regulator PhoB
VSGIILVIEDEADLVDSLDYNLRGEGFQVRTALNGADGLESARQDPRPDLVLLDLMLPDMSGLDVCRELRRDRRTEDVPVVILTARGDEVDRVVGFEVGADDYVTKPFSVRELVLRVKAILRRAHPEPASSSAVTFGRLSMDEDAHKVWVDGGALDLTALEFRLLSTLLARRGRVQSRETLLSDVWGIRGDVSTRTVDTHIKRLRKRLGPAGGYIETLRGVGYRFTDQP